jgi:hypothetical protein
MRRAAGGLSYVLIADLRAGSALTVGQFALQFLFRDYTEFIEDL